MKRTKAQKRATAKMIAANKRRSKSKRRRGKNPIVAQARRRRRNPIARAGTKAGARKAAKTRAAKKAKRSRAAKKAWRTRKAGGHKATKRTAKKSKAKKSKSGRSHASYVKAGKKAAHTRKAKKSGGKKAKKSKAKKHGKRSAASYSKAAKKAARTRKRNRRVPAHMKADLPADQMAYESRRRRKRRSNPIAKAKHRRRRNPIARASKGFFGIKNPIPLEGGLDFFSGVFAVTIGYLFASGADRMGSTHALTASSSQGGYTDAPAAGEIYNSESTMLPIWSSGKRIAFNALAIAAPLGLSAFIKSRGPKAFFQLMAFAAIARTVGKATDDGLSMALKSTSFGLRVYAPELAAVSKASGAGTAALPAAAPGVFAGAPKANALPMADPASRPMQPTHQQVAALPQPTFQAHAPAVHQAPLANDRPYHSGPAFNPWADQG